MRAIAESKSLPPSEDFPPPGCGREVYPRGDAGWKLEKFLDQSDEELGKQVDAQYGRRRAKDDPLLWGLGDAAEKQLRRGLKQYVASHETRERDGVREVKIDRRHPMFGKLFGDAQWATAEEIERRVRREIVGRERQKYADERRRIFEARKAVDTAREELRKREHEFRMLTDEKYASKVNADDEWRHRQERTELRRERGKKRDSWVQVTEEGDAAEQRVRARGEELEEHPGL